METKCHSPLSRGGILGLPDRRTGQEIAAAEEVYLCVYLCVCWHVCVCLHVYAGPVVCVLA